MSKALSRSRGLLDAAWIDSVRDVVGEMLEHMADPAARLSETGWSRSRASNGMWRWCEPFARLLFTSIVHFAHRDRRGTSDALADRAVCREISSAIRNKAPKLRLDGRMRSAQRGSAEPSVVSYAALSHLIIVVQLSNFLTWTNHWRTSDLSIVIVTQHDTTASEVVIPARGVRSGSNNSSTPTTGPPAKQQAPELRPRTSRTLSLNIAGFRSDRLI